jgi:hypothetical protein
MSVDVERDRRAAVPEALLDSLRRLTLDEQDRRVSMPHVVEPDARQPGCMDRLIEVIREALRVELRPTSRVTTSPGRGSPAARYASSLRRRCSRRRATVGTPSLMVREQPSIPRRT